MNGMCIYIYIYIYFLQTSLDHVKRRRPREALHLSPHPKGYASRPSVTPHHPHVRAPYLG